MTVPLANVQISPFSVPQVTVETYNHCNVKSKNLKDDRFPISRVGLELVREVWVLPVSLSFDARTRSSSVQNVQVDIQYFDTGSCASASEIGSGRTVLENMHTARTKKM